MTIVHVDDHIIVVDKPHGQHTQGTAQGDRGTVLADAQKQFGKSVRLVHRLDRDASGLLVLGRTPAIAGKLSEGFKDHSIARTYHASIAIPLPVGTAGTIDKPLKWAGGRTWVDPAGSRAVTHYEVIERAGQLTQLKVQLETGRMHQIRVHLATVLGPIVGDRKYGGARADHLHLRAVELRFTHPGTHKSCLFSV
jgi:RluA family pseudouridine synthase